MQQGQRQDRPSRAWPWVAGPVVGAGLLGGVASMHPVALVATALLAAAAAGAAGCTGRGERYMDERGALAWLRRTGGVAAMLTAAVGAFAAGGTTALSLGAVALATGWVFLVHRDADQDPARAASAAAADPEAERLDLVAGVPLEQEGAAARLGDLTDAQLRQEWRVSYLQVRAASEPARLAHLATARQSCLDEMQRRHPEGFAAWLAAGAAPGSDPSPFFSGRLSP